MIVVIMIMEGRIDRSTKSDQSYGPVTAVDHVSFTVNEGEILGFLGPNGAGKTTTMRILTGYMPATSGTASIAGFDVFGDSLEVRRHIGYLPEVPPVYPDMTVETYLDFVLRIKNVPADKRPSRISEALEKTNIVDKRTELIKRLSRGYKQRVGLAQALVHDPTVIILDEPTVGLDPKQIIEVRHLIKSLAGTHTIILSTHILPEVSMTCDRVVIINKGKIAAVDTPQNLTSHLKGGQRIYVDALAAEKPLEDCYQDSSPPRVQVSASRSNGHSIANVEVAPARIFAARSPPKSSSRVGRFTSFAASVSAWKIFSSTHHRRCGSRTGVQLAEEMMRGLYAIYRKEIGHFFVSPIAYAVVGLFLFISGFFFNLYVQSALQESMQEMQGMGAPPLTPQPSASRLSRSGCPHTSLFDADAHHGHFCRRAERGTMELLMTSPIREIDIVLGKFLASLTLFAAMLLPTAVFVLFMYLHTSPMPPLRIILAGYLGILLFGGSLLALGSFLSSLTENQIIAGVLTFGCFLLLWALDFGSRDAGTRPAKSALFIA